MSIAARRMQRAAQVTVSGGGNPTADAGSVAVGAASYAVPGDAIYVAMTGDDTTGTGTVGAPYQTLAKALTAAISGKTIVLRAGVYHEGSSNPLIPNGFQVSHNNITIQNYPDEAVWFDGSSVQTGWTQSGSTWSIPWTKVFDHSPTQNHGLVDGTEPGWQWINANYPCAPFPEQVFVDGVALTQVSSLGACTVGCFYVAGSTAGDYTFTPTTLYIGTNPSGKTVNVTDRHNFLNMASGYTGLTIRGVGIRRYGNALPQFACLRFDGSNTTTNCSVENVVMEDIATTAIVSNACYGTVIRHVTLRRCGYRALGGYHADNLTIDKVLVEYTNTENFNSSPDSGCVKVTQTHHVTVSNSIFRDSKCKGVWFDASVYDMTVYNNDFLRLKDTGVFFEISGTGLCANNLFVDCPSEAIKVNNTDNMRLWNNTIVRCGDLSQQLNPDTSSLTASSRRPLCVYQEYRLPSIPKDQYGLDSRYPYPNAIYNTYMSWVIHSIDIKNNIVADTPSNAYNIFCIDDLGGLNHTRVLADFGATMSSNTFHWTNAPSTSPPYPYVMPPLVAGNPSPTVYTTHAQFVTGSGLNTNGLEINPKNSGTSNPSPLDTNYGVTSGYNSLHTNAAGLPSDIAALIGQPAGTKHAGVWRS